MFPLHLPHGKDIRFAESIISSSETDTRVKIVFQELPSLGMLIEAAAQSCAAFSNGSPDVGYLAGMKNIVFVAKLSIYELEVQLVAKHSLENMRMIDFEVFEHEKSCAKGSLVIALG